MPRGNPKIKLIVGYAHRYGPGRRTHADLWGYLGSRDAMRYGSIHVTKKNGYRSDVDCKKCIARMGR